MSFLPRHAQHIMGRRILYDLSDLTGEWGYTAIESCRLFTFSISENFSPYMSERSIDALLSLSEEMAPKSIPEICDMRDEHTQTSILHTLVGGAYMLHLHYVIFCYISFTT